MGETELVSSFRSLQSPKYSPFPRGLRLVPTTAYTSSRLSGLRLTKPGAMRPLQRSTRSWFENVGQRSKGGRPVTATHPPLAYYTEYSRFPQTWPLRNPGSESRMSSPGVAAGLFLCQNCEKKPAATPGSGLGIFDPGLHEQSPVGPNETGSPSPRLSTLDPTLTRTLG